MAQIHKHIFSTKLDRPFEDYLLRLKERNGISLSYYLRSIIQEKLASEVNKEEKSSVRG